MYTRTLRASFNVPFIAVSNSFSRYLDHSFRSFRSLFESISIDYKTLQLTILYLPSFYLLPFLASVSRPQGTFHLSILT